MKILNLYAGVGGNRMYWGDEHEITAVELNPSIAACYADIYPHDKVIVDNAHEYLLNHYKEFDFIWSSPPCQSHSQIRHMGAKIGNYDAIFPDAKLWQEIIFLTHYFKKDWVVENVRPYYKPFIQPTFIIGGHLYWSNKMIFDNYTSKYRAHHTNIKKLQQFKKIDLSKYKFKGITKLQILRNMVEPENALYIFQQLTKGK